MYTEAVKH